VPFSNYELVECDIVRYSCKISYDIVLAHLLLGEATKFGNNTFESVLKALLEIETRILVIIDIYNDPDVHYGLLLKRVLEKWTIRKAISIDRYIAITLTSASDSD